MRGEPNIRASRSASGHAGRATRVSTTGASDAPRYRGWRASTSRTPERMPRARTAPSSRASALVLISAQTKKKSFQRDSNPVRATRLLSNLESANFGELLESQTLPQTSRLSVFARDGRAGQCACALAPRRATRDACFALRKRARPHSSRRSRTSTDTRESDARGERVEASEPTRDRRGGVVHDRLAFSRQSLAE